MLVRQPPVLYIRLFPVFSKASQTPFPRGLWELGPPARIADSTGSSKALWKPPFHNPFGGLYTFRVISLQDEYTESHQEVLHYFGMLDI